MGDRKLSQTPTTIKMFHKAIDLEFKDGTTIEVTFRDGKVKSFDMSTLFTKFPQLRALTNRELFLSGRLLGFYGIIWNDELDIEAETIYAKGQTVRTLPPFSSFGSVLLNARAKAGTTQTQLAEITGIDQSDISKIERGITNPTIDTLEKLATGLGGELEIKIVF